MSLITGGNGTHLANNGDSRSTYSFNPGTRTATGMRIDVRVREKHSGSKSRQEVLKLRVPQAMKLAQLDDLTAKHLTAANSASAPSRCQGQEPSPRVATASSGQEEWQASSHHDNASSSWLLQFIFLGRILGDTDRDRTLQEIGIHEGSTIQCMATRRALVEQRIEIHPLSCPTDGGRIVHVAGQPGVPFPPSEKVCCRFGTIVVPAAWEVDRYQLSCVAPPHPAGPVTLSVSFDGGITFIHGPSFWYTEPGFTSQCLAVAVPTCSGGLTSSTGIRNLAFGWLPRNDRDDRPDGGSGVA